MNPREYSHFKPEEVRAQGPGEEMVGLPSAYSHPTAAPSLGHHTVQVRVTHLEFVVLTEQSLKKERTTRTCVTSAWRISACGRWAVFRRSSDVALTRVGGEWGRRD